MACIKKFISVFIVILCVQNVLVSCQQTLCNPNERCLFPPWSPFRPQSSIQPVKCFVCSSIGDGEMCVHSVSRNFLCESPAGMCYTNIVDGKVHRGCVGDNMFPTENSIRKCADGVNCEVCNYEFCNQKILMDTCIQCNNADSGNECRDNPSLKMLAVCTMGQNSITNLSSGCYLVKTGGNYQRGCLQNLKPQDKKTCESQTNECKVCMTPNCNQKADFSLNCYECNGETDANCAEGENLKQVSCNDFSDTCVTGIDRRNGITHRRCFRNNGLALEMTFREYKTCYTNLCNDQIYQVLAENPFKCYRCQGFGCNNLNTAATIPKICSSLNSLYDECFTYIDRGSKFFFLTFVFNLLL